MDRSVQRRQEPARVTTSLVFDLTFTPSRMTTIKGRPDGSAGMSFLRSRCSVSEASFLRSPFTMQIGEALSVHTLHHRHHVVVLSIPSTTPPYLAGPERRSRWCAVRVHLSEAPPLAALDRIGSRGGDG
jgi:hypothetical protein